MNRPATRRRASVALHGLAADHGFRVREPFGGAEVEPEAVLRRLEWYEDERAVACCGRRTEHVSYDSPIPARAATRSASSLKSS